MKLVMKFGGTSVADAACMKRCAGLVKTRSGRDQITIVVSALDGVTEELLDLADAAGAGNQAAIEGHLIKLKAKHEQAAKALGEPSLTKTQLDKLDRLVLGVSTVGELTPRSRDAIVSFGERMSSLLFRKALENEGLKARAFTGQEAGLVTDENFGEAEPLLELSLYQINDTLKGPLEAGDVCVVTGFIAATQHGVTTTIGRGGSDYTATLVGAAIKADEVWIWSDVDGLMSADPRIVPNARLLENISSAEAVEMGLFGAKSMHPRALEPATERKIPVRMKNTFKPDGAGTLITDEGPGSKDVVRSVLMVKDAGLLTATGARLMGEPGMAARLCQALGDAGINIKVIILSVSEGGISFGVSGAQLSQARAVLEGGFLRTGVARHILVEEKVAIVAVIGSNMRGHPGTAARVFGAIGKSRINVIAIAQGSSEFSISFIVKADQGPGAVKALYEEFLGAGK